MARTRAPAFKYRIRAVTKNSNGVHAYALNVPVIVKEKFGDTLFFMYIMDDRIVFKSGCDMRKIQNEKEKNISPFG